MTACKSCKTNIDDLATKCPYCQAYQQWFRNPQYFSLVFFIPLIALMIWRPIGFESESFDEFRDQILVEEVRTVPSDDGTYDIITYNITNTTAFTWKRVVYELNGYDDKDTVVVSKMRSEYSWMVPPSSQAYLSANAARHGSIKKWRIRIVSMETSRF